VIYAVVPAGGQSQRMGRPKLTLPLGDSTVIERVVTALRQAVDRVLVVVAPGAVELADLALRAGADVCFLHAQTPDMRATVEVGLGSLKLTHAPKPDDSWLLAPADHPTLEPAIIRALTAARALRPECSIVVPTHAGRRGHPVLLAWPHAAAICQHPQGEGLNTYLRLHASETLEVPVDTPEVLADLDTPEDYERLLARWR
jgi:CTP:molybdopterin cytidylyltransferase MocA